MKTHRINLDLPPSNRWTSVIPEYIKHMPALEQAYEATLKKEFGIYRFLIKLLLYCVRIPKSYEDELTSISKLTKIKYTTLLGLNLGIEFLCGCTSASTQVAGVMLHLRNMDWDLPILRKLTCQVDYYKQGQLVFSSIQWIGFVGSFTAVKPNLSLSLNYRKDTKVSARQLYDIVSGRRIPITFQIRDVFEREYNFNQVSTLLQSSTSCSCYLLICSSQSSNLIVKNATSLKPKTNLTRLIQTNHDQDHNHFHNTLSESDYVKWCDHDELLLNSKDRWSTCKLLLEFETNPQYILETPPILNDQTVYSCIMNPKRGTFDFVRVYE